MATTAGIIILCLLLLLFSFLSLGSGAVEAEEARKQRLTWKSAPGVVKHSKLHVQKGSALPFYPTTDRKTYTNSIEFTAEGGQTFTVDLGGKALATNQPIAVHYDPSNPEGTATLASPTRKQATGIGLQVFSVVLLLATGAIVYAYFFA
ncbi:DUF3592 domain-containing protein [Kitasatospora sp. NBC_01287]|uniref:DUF3592 domain-containing protein n=1 Tax=Kitasatospora sp. NBC_01287 TaxID=2903573 RepID=UPI0022599DD9|nr:DUF3592 domain-containing protein [Kitasatospora sp. NBC_01287]MCX4751017.1 DUF3592 domain-containing protein [Kitasatospora sp. NBC_01287]